jgi:hypothetical protein
MQCSDFLYDTQKIPLLLVVSFGRRSDYIMFYDILYKSNGVGPMFMYVCLT